MPETITIIDNRTGRSFDVPIEGGAIRATALKEARATADDAGLVSYDPAFLNTASVRSAITFIDGDRGILRYRGYPIEQLAERSTYLETAYLLVFGELPSSGELERWSDEITHHTFVHENVKSLMQGFRYDAHPMGMLISVVAALSTFYPEASHVDDAETRMEQVVRLIAKVPTIAAWSYRHSRGLPYVYPDNELGFAANFLSMMFKRARRRSGSALRTAARRRQRGRAADARGDRQRETDFYSGIIYQALGLPVSMFPVMFAIPRTSGWLAQWLEGIQDPEQKIARPRQLYTGPGERPLVPLDERTAGPTPVNAVA
jgi:citrate synthase